MEKGDPSGLFVNDGSFMERFKQLQQEKDTEAVANQSKSSASTSPSIVTLKPSVTIGKRSLDVKGNEIKKGGTPAGGKLAFSLKQKSKVAATTVKFVADEEEESEAEVISRDEPVKRQKLDQRETFNSSSPQEDVAPSPPSDPAVMKVADKLASFVAKNGRQFEHITRQRNPGDTPFKYYEYRLLEEEKALAQSKDSKASNSANGSTSTSRAASGSQRSNVQEHYNYQTPASALYGSYEESDSSGRSSSYGESSDPSAADSIAMMEFFMKKAAQEERTRQPKQSKDEMPPPASLQGPPKKGHHMGDFIPPEELERFLSACNDAASQKASKEAADRAKIQADNIGHKLLSKMGWREGEGLGSDKRGRADPVMAGEVKKDNLGVGAHKPGEVAPEDDIYEQYKKRMMLGYRYRPNPLNNPRKSYY